MESRLVNGKQVGGKRCQTRNENAANDGLMVRSSLQWVPLPRVSIQFK